MQWKERKLELTAVADEGKPKETSLCTSRLGVWAVSAAPPSIQHVSSYALCPLRLGIYTLNEISRKHNASVKFVSLEVLQELLMEWWGRWTESSSLWGPVLKMTLKVTGTVSFLKCEAIQEQCLWACAAFILFSVITLISVFVRS